MIGLDERTKNMNDCNIKADITLATIELTNAIDAWQEDKDTKLPDHEKICIIEDFIHPDFSKPNKTDTDVFNTNLSEVAQTKTPVT